MEKVFKIISKTLSTAVITVVVLLAILLVGVRLVGITPYTVISGSMEPTYHVGSVVYVKDVDPAALQVGDTITFRLTDEVIATHRIVEVHGADTTELGFRTKGDANASADGITPAADVIGKVMFSIPFLGYVSAFVRQPVGLICVVGVAAVVLLLCLAMESLFTKEKRSEPESGEENNNG